MGKKQKHLKPRPPERSKWRLATAVGFLLAVGCGIFLIQKMRTPRQKPVAASPSASILEPEESVFAQYAGSESCRECHPSAFDSWKISNHGLAERLPNPTLDDSAFHNRLPFAHGGTETHPTFSNGSRQIASLGFEGKIAHYEVRRIIGHEPLRQFLVPHEGGRLQAMDAAFDPAQKSWFCVYGEEDRRPGEWGHWTGRGMNWNSMCASCHNTRLRKNYDPIADAYKTSMAELSVGCEACHGPMKDHVQWQQQNPTPQTPDPSIQKRTPAQVLDTCGSCHSRRAELTGDFYPGEFYFDHYNLAVPDESDVFYPDGQVRDENYVFTSFLSSRMHQAGVHCMDCHHPHSVQTILPGNALCMRCHNGSHPNSPKIEPLAHSRHLEGSEGNLCVNCHMPHTTYMQRHPRRDHGFTIPDPLMTQRFGIPNACNRCHQDQKVEWALRAVENWYGDRMNRYERRRTQWIAEARQGLASARKPLIQMLQNANAENTEDAETSPVWKASAARLLSPWIDRPEVQNALLASLAHTNALVRAQAAVVLAPLAENRHLETVRALKRLLKDPRRNVRVQAAWSLRHQLGASSQVGRELLHYMQHNGDQPTGQMQLGAWALSQQNLDDALRHYAQAARWDPNSPPIRHELAIVHSQIGNRQEALKELQIACRLAPDEAEYQYKLALAWNELNNLDQTVAAFEKAIQSDPTHSRAWYNLGLAKNRQGNPESALDALSKGESASPNDPDIPYARATILYQLGRYFEAKQAAGRALTIRPDYAPARQLLDSLPGNSQ